MVILAKLRCVVLEDEPNTRADLLEKLSTFEELEIVGEAESVQKAFVLISEKKPDSAFMDIKLIGGDIFLLLEKLKTHGIPIPNIVITTGFSEYLLTALNEYHNNIIQYLVKPYMDDWQVKLRKAIDALQAARIKQLSIAEDNNPPEADQYTFVNSGKDLIRIKYDDVVYIEAMGDGKSAIVTHSGIIKINHTLAKCQTEIFPAFFMRVSKAHIVNIYHIQRINKESRKAEVKVNGVPRNIPIGDVYYNPLIQSLV